MKTDRLEGLVLYVAGKLQEKYGRLIGDDTRVFEGVAQQIEGKLQRRGLPRQTAAELKGKTL